MNLTAFQDLAVTQFHLINAARCTQEICSNKAARIAASDGKLQVTSQCEPTGFEKARR